MSNKRKTLYVLPSLFTISSVFCGFLAIVMSLDPQSAQDLHRAGLLIGLAMILDSFDGRVARMTNTQSAFGVQLDSLADLVSFGVAPAVVMYRFALSDLGFMGVFAAFLFIAAGAIRLARFNVQAAGEEGPSRYFIGLPIPAAAGVAVSFVLVLTAMGYQAAPEGIGVSSAVLMVGLGSLMVSNVKYKTFKKMRVVQHEQILLAAVVVYFAFAAVRWGTPVALASVLTFYVVLGLVGAVIGVGKKGVARFGNEHSIELGGPEEE